MSNENTYQEPIETTPHQDWFLEILVETVNAGNSRFGITLTVGGILISGNVISGKDYFRDFANQLSVAIKNDVNKPASVKSIEDLGEVYLDDTKAQSTRFIHLKDVRFYGTDGRAIPTTDGLLWRGMLSNVDGFTLGVFMPGN